MIIELLAGAQTGYVAYIFLKTKPQPSFQQLLQSEASWNSPTVNMSSVFQENSLGDAPIKGAQDRKKLAVGRVNISPTILV